MKQGYNDALVTYDEIVSALESIIDCSITSNNSDDLYVLNNKYETGSFNKIYGSEEFALRDALNSLKKTLISSSKLIRMNLENDLSQYIDDVYTINTEYLIGQERKRIAINESLINSLKQASMDIDILYQPPVNDIDEYKTSLDFLNDIDTTKVFNDFEKRVIADFPEFFKEEIELSNNEDDNTKEIYNVSSEQYIIPEEINDDLIQIKKAMDKALKINRLDIYYKLKDKYEELEKVAP